MDYHPSIDIEKCSSTNTSLNSLSSASSSSLSNRNSSSKLVKTKQRKSSPIKSDCQQTNFDDYSSYEHYYPTSTSNSHSFYPINVNESNYYETKRFRFDHDQHYQTNFSSDYLIDQSYPHTSVIVDSQQYFFNGWNGTTAF